MNVIAWSEELGAGGLVVVVAPVICGKFWFTVIATWAMLRKLLHKEPVSPVAWYD
jgi:hypothetical protein